MFLGIKKGDRVAIYMPMIIELCISLLACARIGAIHSIVVRLKWYFKNAITMKILFVCLTIWNKSLIW